MPGHVLGAAAQAHEPGTRAASAPVDYPGRQPPVRRRGRGASPGAGRGHRPPNPAAWIYAMPTMGCQLPAHYHYRTLHLELRRGPMSRGNARPQPPVGSRGYYYGPGTEEGQRSQPRCRSGSPATEPSGPGAKLDPPDHTQPNPAPHSSLDPGGERRPIPPPLAPLRPSDL
jgi:hypothetical protein